MRKYPAGDTLPKHSTWIPEKTRGSYTEWSKSLYAGFLNLYLLFERKLSCAAKSWTKKSPQKHTVKLQACAKECTNILSLDLGLLLKSLTWKDLLTCTFSAADYEHSQLVSLMRMQFLCSSRAVIVLWEILGLLVLVLSAPANLRGWAQRQ